MNHVFKENIKVELSTLKSGEIMLVIQKRSLQNFCRIWKIFVTSCSNRSRADKFFMQRFENGVFVIYNIAIAINASAIFLTMVKKIAEVYLESDKSSKIQRSIMDPTFTCVDRMKYLVYLFIWDDARFSSYSTYLTECSIYFIGTFFIWCNLLCTVP